MTLATSRAPLAVDLRPSGAVWPRQQLRQAVAAGWITAEEPIEERQFQPASLDLRLGRRAYRVRASFLPGSATVAERLASLAMYDFPLDQPEGAILEKGHVYIIPLLEGLRLPRGVRGKANPKSTTGRLDIFTRVITDRGWKFEEIRAGYAGPLYLEVVPSSFTIRVRAGLSLNQLRLMEGDPSLSDDELVRLNEQCQLILGPMGGRREVLLERGPHAATEPPGGRGEAVVDRGLYLSVDLTGRGSGGIIGYKAKRNSAVIDLARTDYYDPRDFWEPISSREGRGGLILEPEEFLILASKEKVQVPPQFAAEMIAYDVTNGELRTHYAGFFDPGFGYKPGAPGGPGTRAVLEVRAHEVPFQIEDGQRFCKLVFERLTSPPDIAYGPELASAYQFQELTLSKQFRRDPAAGPAAPAGSR
ncbi:MAG TPA: 2'-deoxycytidine 5'-triphosphate deaminase [Thermodesulfobacteriota bacterium]|nr:2'-deoxycytidine 5'-triphosphate deaminase [Thermodesulfobacteriota bacterium]